MSVLEVSIPTGPASFQTITLEGVTIGLRIWWNARAQVWQIDVSDAGGADLASGMVLAIGVPLLRRFGNRSDLPPGVLMAMDTSGQGLEAGREDLGARVRLYYDEASGS